VAALVGAAGGCSTKTETGYEPHRLGMTDAQLRALYAPQFTKEAAAAEQDNAKSPSGSKPGQAGVGL
jgi:hypothetical protein